jgi:transcriptional regulator with XRE-family HTH domain
VKSQLFAKRLRELRIAHGFPKARHFAEAIGISENRYTRYERGNAEPNLDLIYLICEKLRISANELFGTPEQQSAKTPGFAESSNSFPAAPADGDAAPPVKHSTPEANPAAITDAEGWRLATELAAVRNKSSRNPTASTEAFVVLRETASIFTALRSDPYQAVATFLSDPALAAQPRKVQAQLNAQITRYIRALERRLTSQPERAPAAAHNDD